MDGKSSALNVVLQPLDKYSGSRTPMQQKCLENFRADIPGTPFPLHRLVPLVFASCAFFGRLGTAFDATGAFKPQVWLALCEYTHCPVDGCDFLLFGKLQNSSQIMSHGIFVRL